ncbi:hypothetical protein ACTFIZ_000223 [Dictyostelium cf. discoideum]
MDQRYNILVDACSFLKHPVTKVLYCSIATDSTYIQIQTPVDYQVQKGYYYAKDDTDKPKTYLNGENINIHDQCPILATSDATTTANDVANVPPVTQRAVIVNTTLTNDDTRVPASKSKKKSGDYDKELFTSDDDSDRDIRVKKSKLNSIESKTIDAMNAATAVIFMNIFNLYCTQYCVDPSLKTIMDNGAASYELIQLLQPTHNESVKNNDKIEGETLNKLITRNFRSKTTVPVKTDYEATNTKMIEAYYNRNCNSVQDSIKNIEAIMSYSNVINPVYLIHGTAEVQFQYLISILDNTIISLLKMVVPDWLQTEVAIKFNSQTDIAECREAIAELVNNNADKFSKRKSLEPAFNVGDKFSVGKKQSNQAAPTQSSQSRPATYEAAAAKIKAKMLPILKMPITIRVDPVNSKISQYHHLEDYDFSINKDSLYSLNSFYSQNISNELIKQTQQQDVHKNINKLKKYIKVSYGIKLIPDTTVPIPESVKSEMKYKPKKIEFNTSTELPNVDDTNYIVNIFNPKRNNSDKKVINDDKDELLYTVKFDKETDKPIISLLHCTSSSDPILIPTLKCLIVPNKENMNKSRIIINSHTKEQQFKLILDTGSNLDIIDVLFGNDILKDSIINQKDKLIKLNNSTYKITYQQSDQLEYDDDDIKEQVAKFVEGISSQICDIMVKSNPVEEEIQLLHVIVGKLPDIADQINNSKRCNILHNIIIKKDQDVEPTKKQIYYSTDEHKRHVEEMVLKFIDLGIIKRSESNYSSPIMLLKKRDSWRVVHDYRQLNKVTVRDDHPFTPIQNSSPSSILEPRNTKEAEAALGLFGFFRRHIENYAQKTFHLSKESKGKNKKKLSDESIKEFNNLKKEFKDNNTPIDIEKVRASTDMLIQSDNNNLNNGSFHLYCDVSDKALSGVLYQIQGDKFKVIWFHSRKLSDTQKRYSIGDREFLSIIDSLKKFQHLLIGKKVTIYTDHQNLTYIIN